MKKLLMIGVAALLMMAPLSAFAGVRVFVAPSFGWGWYGPYPAPYAYPYPYWAPYGYYAPAAGTVKFDTNVKDAEVYVNGAYAGTVDQLKTMHLLPGDYDIQLRAPGRKQFDERVYVAPGKTVHLKPELQLQAQQQGQ
jgi:hypothetical protein